jgi:hypothetical protein
MTKFNTPPRIPKQGDLPVAHLGKEGHYVPPKSQDEAIIALRRSRPGTLRLLASSVGANVAAELVYASSDDLEQALFVSDVMSQAIINTVWYQFAQGEKQNRRNLPYFPLYEKLEPANGLMNGAAENLQDASIGIRKLAGVSAVNIIRKANLRRSSSLVLRDSAMALVAVPFADRLQYNPDMYSELEVGMLMQEATNTMLTSARTLHEQIGAHPSLAQLADSESHLSVYLRRNMPREAGRDFRLRQEEAIELQAV